jgi:hypothetical protein
MASTETQKPQCPICRKTDQVKTLEAAHNQGKERLAPPPLPGKPISIARYMAFSMLLVGLFIFFILVLVGSESFGQGFDFFELALVLGALVSIIAALLLSVAAFTVVGRNDQESSKQYPEWERGMAYWGRLRYCARDNVIFDPQTGSTIAEEKLSSLVSAEAKNEQQIGQQTISPAH